MFNRLEGAVQRHVNKKEWCDEVDDELHGAHRAVLKAVGPE